VNDPDLQVQKVIEKHWRAMERERILKELERKCHWFDMGVPCPCGAPTPDQFDYIKKLI